MHNAKFIANILMELKDHLISRKHKLFSLIEQVLINWNQR